jgi:hypothetical protein
MSSLQRYGPRFFEVALGIAVLFSTPSSGRAVCTGCPNPSFGSTPRSYPVGGLSSNLAVADLERDGSLDLAVAYFAPVTSAPMLAVLKGTPVGSFGAPSAYTVPPGGSGTNFGVVAGDFTGDGNLDVVFSTGAADLHLFRGNGNGTLQSAVTIPSVQSVYHLASGDFNADGRRDVAFEDAPYDGTAIWIRFGDGAGGFAAAVEVPATPAGDLTVADMNRDGIDDVLVANSSAGSISIVSGSSTGNLGPAQNHFIGYGISSFTVADWNGDGWLDLGSTQQDGGISLAFADGMGGFSAPVPVENLLLNSSQITAGDFNGDGKADFTISGVYGIRYMYLGNGAGGFAPTFLAGIGSQATVADFNRDGLSDLASLSRDVAILLGSPTGKFFEFTDIGGNAGASPPVFGDFDGDGRQDVLAGDGNSVRVLWNDPGGLTPSTQIQTVSNTPYAAGDFNGDGKADLAMATSYPSNNQITIYLAFGTRSFAVGETYAVGSSPRRIVVADFNGDTKRDLAVVNGNSGSVSILLGAGNGTFSAQSEFAVGASPAAAAAGDINGDLKMDLAVLRYDGTLVVLLGNGMGGFSSLSSVSVGSSATDLVLADFDGDHDLDVAASTAFGMKLTVLLGNGSGGFGMPSSSPDLDVAIGSLAIGDVNGDSHTDIVAGSGGVFYTSGGAWVFLGNGAGAFAPSSRYFTGSGNVNVAAGDLDGDGLNDFAVTMGASSLSSMTVLKNTNCSSRRLGLTVDVPSCSSPGVAFSPQPVARVFDDGDNLISCETGLVSASIQPGTGTPGATLNGTTSVNAVGGVATFGNLSVNLAGGGYRLKFVHGLAGTTLSRSFSQGVTVVVSGPAAVCANTTNEYDAGSGYDSYQWTLDSSPISRARRVTLSNLSAGPHTLAVTVTKDGCTVSTSRSINSTSSPSAVVTGPTEVCPYKTGNAASVPDAGAGATYSWTVTNGVITAGAGTPAITFKVGPSGQTVLGVTVTKGGCVASGARVVMINPDLGCPVPVGFFTVAPCRVIDTRLPTGAYGGPSLAGSGIRTVTIAGQCTIPSTAKSVVFNVTVTNPVAPGHLTLFPGGTPLPLTSTINFRSGQTRANNAIVPLGAAGDIAVSSGSSGPVDFILDVNGYFE